jgi:pimeloyl-ACP methyl ester carboxylesterase
MRATATSDQRETFSDLQERLLAHYGVEATSRFVRLAEPDMQVHVIEAGSGAPVVALHGGDGEAVDWAPLLAALQAEFHVYAVDRPGFGLSDPFDYHHVDMRKHAASFVESLLDALGLESVTLAGGSMGGYFALVAALSDPDRIDRLVLVGMPAGLLAELPEGLARIGKSEDAAEAFMDSVDSIEGQKNQYRNMFSVDLAQVPELYLETRLAGLRLPGVKQTWATLLQRIVAPDGSLNPEFYLGDELPQIRQPTLVIWGERDMLGSEIGEASTQRLPNGRFTVIPGIGHFPFLEAPQECATAIIEFLSHGPSVTAVRS